jgi:hypothetical protein
VILLNPSRCGSSCIGGGPPLPFPASSFFFCSSFCSCLRDEFTCSSKITIVAMVAIPIAMRRVSTQRRPSTSDRASELSLMVIW